LYVASAVEAGGTSGGSTHIHEVACGLRALGHKVLVVARSDPSHAIHALECGVPLRTSRWRKELAMLAFPQILRYVRAFKPDVVMERFYNFAGAGVLAARMKGIPALLEVNAPMIDPPGSLKSRVDRALLGSMRRWAVRQARWSAAIVTPLASTVPAEVSRGKIDELPWGANIDRFNPALRASDNVNRARRKVELGLDPETPVAVFLGSFRAWHGVAHFAEAARRLAHAGDNLAFLAIGGGPELQPLQEQVESWDLPSGRFVFAGPQPHDQVPQMLALADIGVAPFDLSAHAPLRAFGFYWSPLKVFEYMAMGLPVVTVDVAPLNEIVRPGKEGLLYQSGDTDGLVEALRHLGSDLALREMLGSNARERVVAHYSWQAHCAALDKLLKQIAHAD
jgi:glycosyltransferase involved in cell wall biosynthesis